MRAASLAGRQYARFQVLSHGRRPAFEQLEDRMLLSGTPPQVTAVYVSSTAWTTAFNTYLHDQGLGDFGFRIPTGSTQQSKPLPWININKISIQFSKDVNVDAADLALTSTTYLPSSGFFYDAQAMVATWTFASNFGKNQYYIDLDADGMSPVADVQGNVLDGEWTNNTSTISGNGAAGGDFGFIFKVLPGDVDQTGLVDYTDYNNANSRSGATTTSANYLAKTDVDGSGTISSFDSQQILSRWGTSTPTTTPLGVNDDAPTTTEVPIVALTNPAANVSISLYAYFADAETSDSSLSYAITSSTNSSLLDVMSLNSGTGQLTVSSASGASGRATVQVTATDASGVKTTSTVTVDVNHTNQAPALSFNVVAEGYDTWTFYGSVSDSDDVVAGTVVEFVGAYNGRATVRTDGTFQFSVIITSDNYGPVVAHTVDRHGQFSNYVERVVDLT